jgi:hypothetical protein
MKLYLDFDGVIIDSAFEAFRVMMSAKNEIEHIFSDQKDFLYEKFRSIRPLVGPAWNYNYIYKILIDEEIIIIPQYPDKDDIEFENNFFQRRIESRQENIFNWINLHNKYNFTRFLVNIIETKRLETSSIKIITNKDAESVYHILRQTIPSMSRVKIISMTDFDYGYKKSYYFRDHLKENEKTLFIDDSENICNEVESLNISFLKTYNARWGYVENNRINTRVIEEDSFERILLNEMNSE